jgi:RecG-like helicase
LQDGLNIDNPLARRLSSFGISEEAVLSLAEAQIETAFHLLLHVPKSIIVHTEVESISSIKPGAHYILMAKVDRVKIVGTGKRSRLSASLKDLTGIMDVVFFGPAVLYARQKLKEGMMVRLSGEVKEFLGRSQMVHPKFVSDKNTFEKTCLSATYPQIAGLTSDILQKIVSKVREKLTDKVEHLADHFIFWICILWYLLMKL